MSSLGSYFPVYAVMHWYHKVCHFLFFFLWLKNWLNKESYKLQWPSGDMTPYFPVSKPASQPCVLILVNGVFYLPVTMARKLSLSLDSPLSLWTTDSEVISLWHCSTSEPCVQFHCSLFSSASQITTFCLLTKPFFSLTSTHLLECHRTNVDFAIFLLKNS